MVKERKRQEVKSIIGLSISLAKAQFKLRTEGSYLGVLWYVLEPLLLFVIILAARGSFSFSEGLENYPAYLLLGLIMFNFFSRTTAQASSAVLSRGVFVRNIKMPLEALPVSKLFNSIFSHLFELLILGGVMLYFGVSLVGLLFYPLVFLILCMFVLGVSFILASVGVYVGDLENAWRVFVRVLWFGTPIFYSLSNGALYKANLFNPMFYLISLGREFVVYGRLPELWVLGGAAGFAIAFFLVGILVFRKFKSKFPENV